MRTTGKLGWKNGLGEGPDLEIRTVYDFLDVLEQKPAVFLGEPSISALHRVRDLRSASCPVVVSA